ncbi:MAG TPA: R3H domain-containing nucleic acid-binding protein [Bryobacteraceae bacterium]|nr:R3H domain-containing nucleic acid-binding protein [Bryobacteraceae bacterium]
MVSDKKYPIETTAPRIENFLETVRKQANLRLSFQITEGQNPHPEIENPEIIVRFSGADVELLLENRAELLLALEQLTMEMLRMPAEDHSLVCFDANDYRMLRIEELRLSALTAAEKVRKTHLPFHFSPMSSRERRIIHLALRQETEVRSESVGIGPVRQVVIVPASMQTLPPPVIPPRPPMAHGDRPPDRSPDRGNRGHRGDRRERGPRGGGNRGGRYR